MLRNRRGVSLPEVLISALILSFVVAGTAGLFQVGNAQQRTARSYSEAQTDLRIALRRATRTIRHGYEVMGASTAGNLAGMASSASQVIVRVPDPGGLTESQFRFHLGGDGTFYAQQHSQAAPGTPLTTGVTALAFNYYQTQVAVDGTVTAVSMDATPSAATEVLVTLTATRGPATTTVKTYIALRNMVTGL